VERSYQDLLTTLLGTRVAPPLLGASSTVKGGRARRLRSEPDSPAEAVGPIRILGVIADEVTEPRLDGTRGSGLYRVPLRLTRRPSHEWARLFERTWDHPPCFTTMHRPGIVSVQGDHLILDGTTMEEVERYHRDTLVLVLEKVNLEIAEHEEVQRRRAEMEQQRREEHRRSVEDAAKRLRFDE